MTTESSIRRGGVARFDGEDKRRRGAALSQFDVSSLAATSFARPSTNNTADRLPSALRFDRRAIERVVCRRTQDGCAGPLGAANLESARGGRSLDRRKTSFFASPLFLLCSQSRRRRPNES